LVEDLRIGDTPGLRSEAVHTFTAPLRVVDVWKSFGGSRALSGVDFDLRPGEIHGLVGENGSGKSTLVKILAGGHSPDRGEIEVHGHRLEYPLAAGSSQSLGMSFVHQDLGLIEDMTICENLRLNYLATRRSLGWSLRAERRRAKELFDRFGVRLNPDAKVRTLPMAERAYLAIIRAIDQLRTEERALGRGQAILVLDEATVSLPAEGKQNLFEMVRGIAGRGDSVIFISHYLDDVLAITDRVTVLRDGRVINCVQTSEVAAPALIRMITGNASESVTSRHVVGAGETGIATGVDVTQLNGRVGDVSGGVVSNVSIEFRRGEILGLTGLLGSGYNIVPELLFGAQRASSGVLHIGGEQFDLTHMTPSRAVKSKIGFVPGNRGVEGLILGLEAWENIATLVLANHRSGFWIRRDRLVRDTAKLMQIYGVNPIGPRSRVGDFSGGNQQKLLLARWLQIMPRLLLLVEPTQGVDVGARNAIFELLREASRQGMAIICASGDQGEIAELCDRVLVFGEGMVKCELDGANLSKSRLVDECYAASSSIPTLGPWAVD
jgi:ribose transport system ATP-binding protein